MYSDILELTKKKSRLILLPINNDFTASFSVQMIHIFKTNYLFGLLPY